MILWVVSRCRKRNELMKEYETTMLSPESLTPDRFEACVPLLRAYPFKPYAHYHHEVGEAALQQFFLAQVRPCIEEERSSALWSSGPVGALGLIAWTRLTGDSQRLGYGVGRLEYLIAAGDYEEQYAIKDALLTTAIETCADQGIKHLTARAHASDLSSVHLLEQRGFIAVDGLLTLSLDLREARCPSPDRGLKTRLFRREDIEQLREIARSSYTYDRFHSDPLIPKPVADELHVIWLEDSCRGRAADAVILAVEQDRVLGFATCKIDHGTTEHLNLTVGRVVLVATAADARRRSVGLATTHGALAWFREHGVDLVEVGTQLRNIPATRLYETCGFRLATSHLTLRKWITGPVGARTLGL